MAFSAHVKWFAEAEPLRPLPVAQAATPGFVVTGIAAIAAMVVLTRLNEPLQALPWVQRIHRSLDRLAPYSPWFIRLGLGGTLVVAGLANFMFKFELVPEPGAVWVRPVPLALAYLILFPRTDRLGAVGVLLFYAYSIAVFGLHHMLDYLSIAGAAYFLLVRRSPWEGSSIAVLYVTTGFSLAWLGVEKWLLPEMSREILERRGLFTFGLPPALFVMLAGWVELGVGYLLITGVLNRFLSLVLTVLFVLTSTIFGVREVAGHWLLHAVLLTFLARGTGPYPTPVEWHKGLLLRQLFVGVNLVLFVVVLLYLYQALWPR